MDYSGLNDACSKDTFPLPQIDQILDATTGHDLLSFLDAYSSYNQIPMFPPDSVSTTFIAQMGMFYYRDASIPGGHFYFIFFICRKFSIKQPFYYKGI